MKQQYSNFHKKLKNEDSGWILIFLAFLLPVLIVGVVFVVDFSNSYLVKQKVRVAADAALHAAGNLWKKNISIRNDKAELERKLESFYAINLQLNGLDLNKIAKVDDNTYEWDPSTQTFTIRPMYESTRFLAPIIGLFSKTGSEYLKTQGLSFTAQYKVDDNGPVILGLAFDISNSTGNPNWDTSRYSQLEDAIKHTLSIIPTGTYVTLNTANAFWVDFTKISAKRAANAKARCVKRASKDRSLSPAEKAQAIADCDQFTDNWIFDATKVVDNAAEENLNPNPDEAPAAMRETLIAKVTAIKKFSKAQNGTHVQGLIARGRTAITDLKTKIPFEEYATARKVLIVLSDGATNASSSDYCLENDVPGDDDAGDNDVNCYVEGFEIPAETTCHTGNSGAPLAAKQADLARKDDIIVFSICVADCSKDKLWTEEDLDGDTFCDPLIDPITGLQAEADKKDLKAAQRRASMKRIANVGIVAGDETLKLREWWKTGPKKASKWPGILEKRGKIKGKAAGDDRNCGWYTREVDCDRDEFGELIPSSCRGDSGKSEEAMTADPEFRNPDGSPLIPDTWPTEIIDDPDILFKATSDGKKPPKCERGKPPEEYDFGSLGKELKEAMEKILDIVQTSSDQLIQ